MCEFVCPSSPWGRKRGTAPQRLGTYVEVVPKSSKSWTLQPILCVWCASECVIVWLLFRAVSISYPVIVLWMGVVCVCIWMNVYTTPFPLTRREVYPPEKKSTPKWSRYGVVQFEEAVCTKTLCNKWKIMDGSEGDSRTVQWSNIILQAQLLWTYIVSCRQVYTVCDCGRT